MQQGMVYLVGAGPGDPGLITVKGLACLSKAEVIVYDHLLDECLMEAAQAGVEKIYAGKKAGCHALKQEEINQLLVDKAAAGKIVVRLKGGDPFVLGRGGEEAEALRNAGLPFEVVPGITSSISAPAYAGIPVTHRTLASSFSVITGHEDPAKETSSINWAKAAIATDTLVFLMGTANLPRIVAKLIEHGRAPQTPAAVIMNGTRPEQKVVTGTLDNIVEVARKGGIQPPSITVVGDVVSMRQKINWFDNRPLHGRKVLVTRSRSQASELSRALSARGAIAVELPVISIIAGDEARLDAAVNDAGRYDWVIFTSVNGVEAFFQSLDRQGKDSRWFAGSQIAAIGPATAAALEARCLRPDFMPAEYTAEAVLAGFGDEAVRGQRFLLPRADIAPPLLAEGLQQRGGEVVEIAAYRTRGEPGSDSDTAKSAAAGCEVITFCSSSTVEYLLKLIPAEELTGKIIACIGPVTAATAEQSGLKVTIQAGQHTIPGLVEAIEEYYAAEGDGE
ncbi:MAG: uroporphyrinogen-III C-methyltransferase [Dehalogenimonas sp.]|uniref:uroporphyrinogen-III C-methyltransferase n=1 Tax=Candidatus Dehalogenimonas loeffleri TaxID=3127115 RepID=A0ABZ2J759_9CHLR|nr:uroporphyrinogen-III C-methyltransferase [Dehalogenimonas sp.]